MRERSEDPVGGGDFRTVVGELGGLWFGGRGEPVEVAPRTWFVQASFTNASFFETDEGLLLVDTGTRGDGPTIFQAARRVSRAPLRVVVFTHGHIDHAFGLGPWLEAGERPRVVAHRGVPERFRRYLRTAPLQRHVNQVQFGLERLPWPATPGEYFWPDTLYEEALTLRLGGETFELHHAKGETDDATWVWCPGRRVLCTGDLWIGCAPNCGNPQKVQRYPEEWAEAAETMAGLGAQVLVPGHSAPVVGADRVRTCLLDLAAYLHAIAEQTLAALNRGLTHEEVVASVAPPPELAAKPYLQPLYDRPEFIVRNLIRRYGGWWDGHPANLLPAPAAARAREVAVLAGGVGRLVARARELASSDLPLACHLAEWAALAAPDDPEAQACVRDVFLLRARQEPSLMARGVFVSAVRRARAALEGLGDPAPC